LANENKINYGYRCIFLLGLCADTLRDSLGRSDAELLMNPIGTLSSDDEQRIAELRHVQKLARASAQTVWNQCLAYNQVAASRTINALVISRFIEVAYDCDLHSPVFLIVLADNDPLTR
jgi:hypothetical protein